MEDKTTIPALTLLKQKRGAAKEAITRMRSQVKIYGRRSPADL